MNELTALNQKEIVSIFVENKIDETLSAIEKEVLSVVPDITSVKGRKEVASLAHKVSKSKVALDNAGKTLVSDWKAKSKLVDASRKEARDFLDNLKTKVRLPLTKWENEEEIKAEKEKLKIELEEAQNEAVALNNLFDREAAIAEKERIAAEKEAEQLKIKEVARLEAEKLEREKLLKERAAEQAKLQAEQEAQAKIDDAKRLETEAKDREEQAKQDAIAAKVRAEYEAEQAEIRRLQAVEDAKLAQEQAVKDAEEKIKHDNEVAEQNRLAIEAEEKAKAERKAANLNHRKKVNNIALTDFIEHGIKADLAKDIIKLIATGKISNVVIEY